MGEKGVKRSSLSLSGSCTPVSSPLHTCGAGKKNALGNGSAAGRLQPQRSGGCPEAPRAVGVGLCIGSCTLQLQPAELWGFALIAVYKAQSLLFFPPLSAWILA